GMRPSEASEDIRQLLATRVIYGDPDSVGEQVGALLDAGLDGMMFNVPNVHDSDAVALLAQTLRPILAP
ncbi:MAG TPA: hypothetical protein VL916_11465, partial [Ilumatobacteraceae bacterium]|nr:hypothetical protein [Ilumatobacteraceae bacterium]